MSRWCVALLGVAKLVLGLGSSLVKILDQLSVGVLGVLLLFDGIELAMCSRDMNSKEKSVVMLICMLFHLLAQVPDHFESKTSNATFFEPHQKWQKNSVVWKKLSQK
ncbi:Uncharacterized protein Fot_55200 [Forsythia ovata]|uniref:Uncharacterized protein n=1 Tax=Forsythia ovata TaxID=205694 RepID=A0ABD1P5M9_9LAMI